MRFVLRLTIWLRRLVVLGLLLAVVLGGPVAYVEFSCRGSEGNGSAPAFYTQLPGYFIAGAEADYAAVLAAGDPHEFGFWGALEGYWTGLCGITERAAAEGGLSTASRKAIYARGAGFTASMLARAAYEETLGRLMTIVRGPAKAPLDGVVAAQAAAAARGLAGPAGRGLDYGAAARELIAANSGAPRDYERMIALNIGYRASGLISGAIEMPAMPALPPLLEVRVTGIGAPALARIEGLSVVAPAGAAAIDVEAAPASAAPEAAPAAISAVLPADADAVRLLTAVATAGGGFAEISGRTGTVYLGVAGEGETGFETIAGSGNRRVAAVPVAELAPLLARLATGPLRAERLILP